MNPIFNQNIFLVKEKIGMFKASNNYDVFEGGGRKIGVFKQKFFSFGGRFEVHDHQDKHLCTLQGKWTGWDFKFNKDNKELANVSKKWAGLGKEFFTSADNYVINITDVAEGSKLRPLLIAAVMCIDMVFKE